MAQWTLLNGGKTIFTLTGSWMTMPVNVKGCAGWSDRFARLPV
jgi:hypothetical protein